MKHTLLAIVTVFVYSGVSSAQLANVWRIGDFDPVYVDASGNSITFTRIKDPTNSYFVLDVQKIDADGALVFQRSIDRNANTWARGIQLDDLGNIYILSVSHDTDAPFLDVMYLTKLTSGGNVLFDLPLSPQMNAVTHINTSPSFVIDRERNLYLGSVGYVDLPSSCWNRYDGTTRAYLSKFNTDGVLIWEYLYPMGPEYRGSGFFYTDSITGNTYAEISFGEDNCYTVNEAGNCTLIDGCVPNYFSKFALINNHGLPLFDELIDRLFHLFTITKQGNAILMSRQYGDVNELQIRSNTNVLLGRWNIPGNPYYALATDDESKIVVYSGIPDMTGNDLPSTPVLTCYDFSGSIVWQEMHLYPESIFSTVLVLKANRYLYYFLRQIPTGGGATNHFLVKKDILTGSEEWRAPVAGAGALYIDDNDYLYFNDGVGFGKYSQRLYLTLQNAKEEALTNRELYLIRVSGDPPNQTEDTLGTVETDTDGRIPLNPTQP